MEINLDTLNDEVAVEYDAVAVRSGEKVVVLQPYMLLPKEKRRILKAHVSTLDGSTKKLTAKLANKDEEELIVETLAMAADDPATFREMVTVGDLSLAALFHIFTEWRRTVQLPEASSSPN